MTSFFVSNLFPFFISLLFGSAKSMSVLESKPNRCVSFRWHRGYISQLELHATRERSGLFNEKYLYWTIEFGCWISREISIQILNRCLKLKKIIKEFVRFNARKTGTNRPSNEMKKKSTNSLVVFWCGEPLEGQVVGGGAGFSSGWIRFGRRQLLQDRQTCQRHHLPASQRVTTVCTSPLHGFLLTKINYSNP